jgi:hypothetical protein
MFMPLAGSSSVHATGSTLPKTTLDLGMDYTTDRVKKVWEALAERMKSPNAHKDVWKRDNEDEEWAAFIERV